MLSIGRGLMDLCGTKPRSPKTAKGENKMGRPLKIAKLNGSILVDIAIPGGTASIGGVGGDTAIVGSQIQVRVKIGANPELEGYIIRQKGRSKFLVTDGTNTGVCTLADSADGALADDFMSLTATDDGSSIIRASRISNKFIWSFSDVKYQWTFGAAVAGPPIILSVENT